MGLLGFHDRMRDFVPHAKLYVSDDPTEQCTVMVEDAMTRLYRLGQNLTANDLYRNLVRPWKRFFDQRQECTTPLIVVVVFDKEKYKPAMKRAVQAQRSAKATTEPYTPGTYIDLQTQTIRDGETHQELPVEGPRIMRTPSLKKQLPTWLWQCIQLDQEQWPTQTCLILDFDDELHLLNKANYPGLEPLYKMDPIGEAEINATRWLQRIQALPAPHSHQHVLVLTRDTDVALLLVLHIPGRIYWNYDPDSWMRVHVLRDYILNVFGGRLDLFLVLNVINGCDFFTRGDLIHQMREEVVWKVLVYSLDLRPLESFADFSLLMRRLFGVMLKLLEVRSDYHPASLDVPTWPSIQRAIAKTKRYRMPKDLDQSFMDVRQVAVYWYTLQEHTNHDSSLVKAMTNPWETGTRIEETSQNPLQITRPLEVDAVPCQHGLEPKDPPEVGAEAVLEALPEVEMEAETKRPDPTGRPKAAIRSTVVGLELPKKTKRVRFPELSPEAAMGWKKAKPLMLVDGVAAMSE